MKKVWIVLVAMASAVFLYAKLSFLLPYGNSSAKHKTTVVYLCSETHDVVIGPPQPTPAINPQTDRRTLVRALYCVRCGKWNAVQPSDRFGGNPLSIRCPKHKTIMSPNGPVDEAHKIQEQKN